jgi:hypothetical protein
MSWFKHANILPDQNLTAIQAEAYDRGTKNGARVALEILASNVKMHFDNARESDSMPDSPEKAKFLRKLLASIEQSLNSSITEAQTAEGA